MCVCVYGLAACAHMSSNSRMKMKVGSEGGYVRVLEGGGRVLGGRGAGGAYLSQVEDESGIRCCHPRSRLVVLYRRLQIA